ncbi:hypothetical protein GO986_18090 [Deinococcus sp. HMF7620]|uniref:Uncharacterized protein n=1 Tax=Deinococcus arboris TaxID=2682977 RepID=A0A7C9I0X0_9DEIO|nr:hypothetical protein [Deinococcus arboris]MVN88650.1 hypothetical protein [Deinococcus arboris]
MTTPTPRASGFKQGQDATVTVSVSGVTLPTGITVQAQLRTRLQSEVLYDMGVGAEVSGQSVTLKIPGAQSKAWTPKAIEFELDTTVILIGPAPQHAHLAAFDLVLVWQAGYTRSGT